jgi:MFS family permease
MLTDISSESVAAVLPLYLTAVMGLSPFAYGAIDGIYQGVGATVRLLGGWAADRFDHPKWIAAAGYGLSAATRAMLLLAQTFASVTSVVTVDRIGKGLRTAPRDAMIAAVTPPDAQGQAFGVHRTLDTVGAMIGPLVAFAVLSLYPYGGGYPAVFVVSTAFAVVGVTVLVVLVPPVHPVEIAATTRAKQDGLPQSDSGGRPSAIRRVMLAAGILAVATISDGFLFLQLADRDGLAVRYFPLLVVGVSAVYLTLAVPMGRLADRLGRTRVFLGGHVALLGAYVTTAGTENGPVAVLSCLVLLGVYYAATDGVLAALVSRLAAARRRGTVIAGAQTVVAVGRFLASLGFGWLWTQSGASFAIVLFVGLLGVGLPVAALILRGVDDPDHAR